MTSDTSWIKYRPFGGADTVTGSRHLITITINSKEKNYLFDSGLFQGHDAKDEKADVAFASIATKLDAVFLTHAHIDHIGMLPYLYKMGYRGPVYATEPVRELAEILLHDSMRILNGLYDEADLEVMNQFKSVWRNKSIKIDEYLTVCFYNAGHSLGSGSIMAEFTNGEEKFKIYFSGDVGQNNPILKRRIDSLKEDVDFVVMESTYANREHRPRGESWNELREAVATTILNGGNVVFPAFAVGRTQELLYLYYKDMTENNDWVAEIFRKTPVFVDCTLAVNATKIFKKSGSEFKAEVAKMMGEHGNNPFDFPNLYMSTSREESKRIINRTTPYIVFSGAGMCNAGRVLYHLERNLPDPKSTVIFTGYQAEGTLGRMLVEGKKEVKIYGKIYPVKSRIYTINAFSAHADQNGLIKWLEKIYPGYILFLAHGEPTQQALFKNKLVLDGIVDERNIELLKTDRVYNLRKGGFYTTAIEDKPSPRLVKKPVRRRDSQIEESIRQLKELLHTVDHSVGSQIKGMIYTLEQYSYGESKRKKNKKRQEKRNKKNRKYRRR